MIDGALPDGGNCYRRSLIEIALDKVAAQESLNMGFAAEGGLRSGHAWLGRAEETNGRYEVIVSL